MSKLSASSVRTTVKTLLMQSSLEGQAQKNDDGTTVGKKRNFVETIELQIGLKNYDPQRDKRFSGTIKLPNVPRPRMSVCILADAAHVDQAKQIELEYMTVEDLKKLTQSYPLSFLKNNMAIAFKSGVCFLHSPKPQTGIRHSSPDSSLSFKRLTPIAALSTSSPTLGLADTFTQLKKQGKVAFIPYITAGDPDLSTTAEALKVLDACGSDIIELGVPYSDPLADGPVIQAAATRSLEKGTNLDNILDMLDKVLPELSCPVSLFTYYNPILKRGLGKFMSSIRDVGVQGLVVPDVPLEETELLREGALSNGIELVLLTTPTTPTERMKRIVEASEGFIYLVSSIGVTGARASVSGKVESLLKDIKEATDKPVAVGFGISKPEHVKQLAGWGADGVIVGSAMVRLLGDAKSPTEGLKELERLTKSLKSALL